MFGRKASRQEEPTELRCSFCNKGQNEVRKLIAGPTVYICDHYVRVCVGILADERAGATRQPSLPGVPFRPWPESDAWCALCGEVVDLGTALLIENRTLLCNNCVQAISTAARHAEPSGE